METPSISLSVHVHDAGIRAAVTNHNGFTVLKLRVGDHEVIFFLDGLGHLEIDTLMSDLFASGAPGGRCDATQ